MASRKPLVVGADGRPQQLQTGDTLNAAVSETETQQWTNGDVAPHIIGDVVYIFTADTVKLAQANAAATAEAIAIAAATIAPAAVGSYQTSGTLAGLTGLVAGSTYFLSPTVPGGTTTTVPTAAGQWVVEIGKAISTTELLIRIREPIAL